MRGPKPTSCNFSEDFLQEARQTARKRTARWQDVQRSRLVLLLHDQPHLSNDAVAQQIGLSARQVRRWRQRWIDGDFTFEDREGRGRKAHFPPGRSCSGGRHRL
jgi:transposase-like protein